MAKEAISISAKNLSIKSLAAICQGLLGIDDSWQVKVPKEGQSLVFFLPDSKDDDSCEGYDQLPTSVPPQKPQYSVDEGSTNTTTTQLF